MAARRMHARNLASQTVYARRGAEPGSVQDARQRHMKVERGCRRHRSTRPSPGWITCFASLASGPRSCAAQSCRAARRGRSTSSILVMGESYSAGNGAGSYIPGSPKGCYRSSRNYARELQRKVERSGQAESLQTWPQRRGHDGLLQAPEETACPRPNRRRQHGFDVICLTIGGNALDFDASSRTAS
jgi:hypothetical protein